MQYIAMPFAVTGCQGLSRLSRAVPDCRGLSRAVSRAATAGTGGPELPRAATNCQGLPRAVPDCHELPRAVTGGHELSHKLPHRLPRAATRYHTLSRLSRAFPDCPGLSRAVTSCHGLSRAVLQAADDLVGSDVQQFSTLSGEDAAVKEAKEAGYQIECGLAIRTLKRTCVRRPA